MNEITNPTIFNIIRWDDGTMGRWDDGMIDPPSDGPMFPLIDWE